jgi:hypothetical protein
LDALAFDAVPDSEDTIEATHLSSFVPRLIKKSWDLPKLENSPGDLYKLIQYVLDYNWMIAFPSETKRLRSDKKKLIPLMLAFQFFAYMLQDIECEKSPVDSANLLKYTLELMDPEVQVISFFSIIIPVTIVDSLYRLCNPQTSMLYKPAPAPEGAHKSRTGRLSTK